MKASRPYTRSVVIRPLAYVAEDDLTAYAEQKAFPIIPCTLCGSQDNLQRKVVGRMLEEWEKRHPGRIDSILKALSNVAPSHLLDRQLFDFVNLKASLHVGIEEPLFAEP